MEKFKTLCGRIEGSGMRNNLFAGTPGTLFVKYLLAIVVSCKEVAVKAVLYGTKKASKHWQKYSSHMLVTNMLFQQNDINPYITSDFMTTWIWSSTATILRWSD